MHGPENAPLAGAVSTAQYPASLLQSPNTADHDGPPLHVAVVAPFVEYPLLQLAPQLPPIDRVQLPTAPLSGVPGTGQYDGLSVQVTAEPVHVPDTAVFALQLRVAVPPSVYPALHVYGPHEVPSSPLHPPAAWPLAGAVSGVQ